MLQVLSQHCPEALNYLTDIPVFLSAGGAAKMAYEFDVPFLGRMPLDPALGLAGENGVAVSEIPQGGLASNSLNKIVE